MFITVSLLVLCKHSAAGHVNTSRLISVSMLCGAAAQNKPNDSFHNAFTSCLTQSECVCMRKLAGDGVKKDRQSARVRARTHRSVGLLYEFLFPHLEAALSLLQLLLFSAQVSLQLLQAIQSRLNLTPSHRGNITQTPSYHRCTHSQTNPHWTSSTITWSKILYYFLFYSPLPMYATMHPSYNLLLCSNMLFVQLLV